MKNKHLIALIMLFIIVLGLTLIPYFIRFHNGIPYDQVVFANFGSYVGGVVSPLLSFITIIILIYNIQTQRKEIIKASNESKKKDLFDVLKDLELQLDDFLSLYLKDEIDSAFVINQQARIIKLKTSVLIFNKFLKQLYELDSKSPMLDYYNEKYQGAFKILNIINVGCEKYNLQEVIDFLLKIDKEFSIV